MSLASFQKKISIQFKNESLLETAFTHRSYLNENRGRGTTHNERLEYLGDAVLELIVTDFLYRTYPHKPEGEMTVLRSALVNTVNLGKIAESLGLDEHLLLSRGERKDTGRARGHILANTFEALTGAIFLDQGYEVAQKFILTYVTPTLPEIIKANAMVDAKSFFQERAQEERGVTPSYKLVREVGPDHDKRFVMGVYIGEEKVAEGEGQSKQEAEQMAARKGMEVKGWKIR